MRFAMLFTLVCIPLLVAIPLLIGFYVYRDASSRGMNALLWALLALLAPAFSGLILYLLVRGSRDGGSCPQCGQRVRTEYTVCPNCGAKLRPACSNCGYPVERDWTACPRCAQPLKRDWTDVTPPEVRPDHMLGKVLTVIVLVPVLLIAFALLMLSQGTGGGSSGQTTVDIGEYLAASDHSREVQDWLGTADRNDRAYALRYATKNGDEYETRYVVYIPALQEENQISFGVDGSFFGLILTLKTDADPGGAIGGGGRLVLLLHNGEKHPRLRVELNGRQVDCLVTDVDWPLELRTEDVYLA